MSVDWTYIIHSFSLLTIWLANSVQH